VSLDSEAEARARAAVDAAEDGTQAARDALARRDAEIQGLQTQTAYLTALTRGGPEGVAMPTDPATLSALLATLGTETARINTELQAARETRRADEDRLEEAMLAQRAAEIALQALTPFGTESMGIRLDVQAVEPTSGTIEIAYLTPDAQWQPRYDLNLDSETGQLDIDRAITLRVTARRSGAMSPCGFPPPFPNRRRFPSFVGPDPVRINPRCRNPPCAAAWPRRTWRR
jgi:hypothetical protein